MFHPLLHRPHRVSTGVRAASYLAAVAAGAAGLALWRRVREAGRALRRSADPVARAASPGSATGLTNAGWAEIADAQGAVLGRARVMLAAAGQPPEPGTPLAGELRSLRLTSGVLRLFPGRYWVRFETSQSAHAIEVTATPGEHGTDGVTIRWDDLDLPASLVERAAN